MVGQSLIQTIFNGWINISSSQPANQKAPPILADCNYGINFPGEIVVKIPNIGYLFVVDFIFCL